VRGVRGRRSEEREVSGSWDQGGLLWTCGGAMLYDTESCRVWLRSWEREIREGRARAGNRLACTMCVVYNESFNIALFSQERSSRSDPHEFWKSSKVSRATLSALYKASRL
jgi:hypothetical protein